MWRVQLDFGHFGGTWLTSQSRGRPLFVSGYNLKSRLAAVYSSLGLFKLYGFGFRRTFYLTAFRTPLEGGYGGRWRSLCCVPPVGPPVLLCGV